MISARVKITITIILLLFIGSYMYIKVNPPLLIGGVYSYHDTKTKNFEIINKGFFDISLTKIEINNLEKPRDVKLAISKSEVEAYGAILDETRGITIFNPQEVKIHPRLSEQHSHERKDFNIIQSYGLQVSHDEPINQLIIAYKYLGMPFTFVKSLA